MEAPTEMAMTSSKKGTFRGGVGTWGRAYGRAVFEAGPSPHIRPEEHVK